MFGRNKITTILAIYWILLIYVISALVWWYIALSKQNHQITAYKKQLLISNSIQTQSKLAAIEQENDRKTAQYIGEGAIFFLLILAGAVFLFRAVKKQLKLSQDQQNFMVAVTHELKTPLAVAKLNLETLRKRKLDEQQQHKLIGNTLAETNRMNALCSNLLLNSQMEAGGYTVTHETITLSAIILSTLHDFRLRYPDRKLEAGISNESLQVHADAFLLQIALNNLIDNAVKYAGKEATITISSYASGQKSYIEVTDNGPGIPDHEKKQVFEKYRRLGTAATQRSKGTGLGLYLVKRIMTAMNGSISLEDHQPSGCRFVIGLS